jgi:hypothetical protein
MSALPGTITSNRDGRIEVRLRNGGVMTGSFSCGLSVGTRVYAFINYDSMRLVGIHPRDAGEDIPDDEPLDREEVFTEDY